MRTGDCWIVRFEFARPEMYERDNNETIRFKNHMTQPGTFFMYVGTIKNKIWGDTDVIVIGDGVVFWLPLKWIEDTGTTMIEKVI